MRMASVGLPLGCGQASSPLIFRKSLTSAVVWNLKVKRQQLPSCLSLSKVAQHGACNKCACPPLSVPFSFHTTHPHMLPHKREIIHPGHTPCTAGWLKGAPYLCTDDHCSTEHHCDQPIPASPTTVLAILFSWAW